MNDDVIKIDYPAQNVCRILINRPAKLNAINFEVREAMLKALPPILKKVDNRALIFGGVEANLSAGGDVPSMHGLTAEEARERMQHIHRLCRLVEGADIPVITVAEGISAGGAIGLALLGDYIYASASAKILIPFLKLGLVPDWGMMRSLPQRIGVSKARQLFLDMATLTGKEAFDIGLCDACLPAETVMADAIAKAAKLAFLPRQATANVKARLRQKVEFETDLGLEERDQIAGLTGPEFEEGFAAFKEKRKPAFKTLKDENKSS